MSAALRLVDARSSEPPPSSHTTPTLARPSRPTMLPTQLSMVHPSLRPTLVPSSRPTMVPMSVASTRATEPPVTQRSVTAQPRMEAVARIEAHNIIGLMRCNVSFLETLLRGNAPLDALGALEDLHQGLDRLEDRFASSLPLGLTRT